MISYDSMQFNIVFSPVEDFRGKINEIERVLSDFFPNSFSVLPIPDNAPPEIPRMLAVSPKQHSNIRISANAVQLVVQFDEDFRNDMDKCYGYTEERVKRILKLVLSLSKEVRFIGLLGQCVDKQIEEPIQFIKDKFFKIETRENIFDLSTKFTCVADDNYYVNLELFNLRYDVSTDVMGISLDINDRYRDNFKKIKVDKTQDAFLRILELHKCIMGDKINVLLKTGVFGL